MIGETIGSYTILRRLGEGGMGEVYLAEHKHIARRAAIKLLLPEFTTKTDVVSRFFTEARATSLIRHPGIVEILDCAVHTNGRAYIIMEFLDGESLAATIERLGSFSSQPKSALAILGQIASALAAAHSKSIIHRDLKPDNVFLATPTGEGGLRIKILDFGIAKLAAEGQAALQRTRTGSLLGTPIYMSPEQCRGAGAVDHRTDIYSLGCIAYELFAGHPPFVREGAGELLVAHMSEKPRPLSELSRAVTPELEDLVLRMLAKEPAKRPGTALEVVQALEGLLRTRSGEFNSLIETPQGFPRSSGTNPSQPAVTDSTFANATTAAGASAPGTSPGVGSVGLGSTRVAETSPVADPVIGGGTRLLAVVDEGPSQPQRSPKTQTMFSRTASESITQNTRRSTSAKGMWMSVGAAAVIGIGVVALWPKKEPPAKPPTTTDTPIAEKQTPPGQEASGAKLPEAMPAVFELSSEPAGAQVWMPEESSPRGVTPLKLALPPGGGARTVILKATGFQDKNVALEPGHEGALAVILEPAPKGQPDDRADDRADRAAKGTPEDSSAKGDRISSSGKGKRDRRPKKDEHGPYRPMGD